MNTIKLNFKAAAHYLNALRYTTEQLLLDAFELHDSSKHFLDLYKENKKKEKEYIEYLEHQCYELMRKLEAPINIFEKNQKDAFTNEENKIISWLKNRAAEHLVKKSPEALNDPKIAEHYFSFIDKR